MTERFFDSNQIRKDTEDMGKRLAALKAEEAKYAALDKFDQHAKLSDIATDDAIASVTEALDISLKKKATSKQKPCLNGISFSLFSGGGPSNGDGGAPKAVSLIFEDVRPSVREKQKLTLKHK